MTARKTPGYARTTRRQNQITAPHAIDEQDIQEQLNTTQSSTSHAVDEQDVRTELNAANDSDSELSSTSLPTVSILLTNTAMTDAPSEPSTTPRRPRQCPHRITVAEIKALLHVTPAQGRQLHDFIRDDMAACGLLRTIRFGRGFSAQEKEMLQRILDGAKQNLDFLQETGLEEERLNKLLFARAKITNNDEKHNEYFVKTGKVHTRAVRDVAGVEAEKYGVGASRLPVPRLTARGTRSSVVTAGLAGKIISGEEKESEVVEELQEEAE